MANYVKNDRFGNPYQVVGCKDKKGTGFYSGYVELKNQLYKVEPSEAKKDGIGYWVKITKVSKQTQNRSM